MQATGPLIVVADDHPLMRAALCQALDGLQPRASVVQAATAADALDAALAEPAPDLVLMDLRMPDAAGTTGVRMMRDRAPHVPIAVVSA
ncbi:MAG TPA: response regulator, partial [Casimicrobiaceae bacterium]|nr:response regulator [Casimicrobiaceae bacterium]